jgi:hypothetical protein
MERAVYMWRQMMAWGIMLGEETVVHTHTARTANTSDLDIADRRQEFLCLMNDRYNY